MKNISMAAAKKPANKDKSKSNHSTKPPIDDDGPFNPVRAEMALWRAVITQALMDAGSESQKAEAIHDKAEAIRWLLGNSDDFIAVCLNAGLDPDYVRTKASEALKRGCAWRQGMEHRAQNAQSNETKQQLPTILLKGKPIALSPSPKIHEDASERTFRYSQCA